MSASTLCRSSETRPGRKAAPAGIEATASADSPNVAALTRNAVVGEPSSSRGADDGATSDRDHSDRGAGGVRAGQVGARHQPWRSRRGTGRVRHRRSGRQTGQHGDDRGRQADSGDASEREHQRARSRSELIITARRSYRSASAPPSGPRTTIGSTRATVVAATHPVLCVARRRRPAVRRCTASPRPARRRDRAAAGRNPGAAARLGWCPARRSRPPSRTADDQTGRAEQGEVH